MLHQAVVWVRNHGERVDGYCTSPPPPCLVVTVIAALRVAVCRYAVYAGVFGLLYVVGLPLGVFVILYRRRNELYSVECKEAAAANRERLGFLFEVLFELSEVLFLHGKSLSPSLLSGAGLRSDSVVVGGGGARAQAASVGSGCFDRVWLAVTG